MAWVSPGIQQRHDMTPRRKGARFLIHPMFARQLAYQLSRNKVAKLMQYTQLVRGWFCPFGFSSFLSFHRWFLNRNHRLTTRPTFFFCYLWDVIACKSRNLPWSKGGKGQQRDLAAQSAVLMKTRRLSSKAEGP